MYNQSVIVSYQIIGDVLKAVVNALDQKFPREATHSRRVSKLSRILGAAMGLPKSELNKLQVSGLLHDIGKIAIDESVLNKKEVLTSEEWNMIKRHTEIGFGILRSLPEMSEIAEHVLYHHERFDGTGYPKGLKEDQIPLLSRIIAVADSYDAMISQRPYRDKLNRDMAINELIVNKGKQFDPDIVDVFLDKVINNKTL